MSTQDAGMGGMLTLQSKIDYSHTVDASIPSFPALILGQRYNSDSHSPQASWNFPVYGPQVQYSTLLFAPHDLSCQMNESRAMEPLGVHLDLR